MARPFAEVRRAMLERARAQRNPFEHADPDVVEWLAQHLRAA